MRGGICRCVFRVTCLFQFHFLRLDSLSSLVLYVLPHLDRVLYPLPSRFLVNANVLPPVITHPPSRVLYDTPRFQTYYMAHILLRSHVPFASIGFPRSHRFPLAKSLMHA